METTSKPTYRELENLGSKYRRLILFCIHQFTDDEFVSNAKKICESITYTPPEDVLRKIFGEEIEPGRRTLGYIHLMFAYCVNHQSDDGMKEIIHAIDQYMHPEWNGFEQAVLERF